MLLTQRKNGLPLGLLFQLFFFLPSSASSSLSFFLCWMHPFNIEIWVRHHQFVTSAFMTLCIFALLWKIITNPGLGRLDIDIYIPAHPHDVLLIFVSFYVHTINPFEIHLKGQCDRWTWLWFLNEQSFASLPFFFFFLNCPSFLRGFKYLLLPYANFIYTQILSLCALPFPVNFSVSNFFHATTSLF